MWKTAYRSIRPEMVVEECARRMSVPAKEVRDCKCHRATVLARRMAIIALREAYPYFSLQYVGGLVGLRDHSAVLYHIRKADDDLRAESYSVLHDLAARAEREVEAQSNSA